MRDLHRSSDVARIHHLRRANSARWAHIKLRVEDGRDLHRKVMIGT